MKVALDIMEEGSRLHREHQAQCIEKYFNTSTVYKSEVKIKELIEYKNIPFEINGRVDSVILTEDKITIEELKSVSQLNEDLSLTNNKAYLAQLMIYAYFLTKALDEDFKIEIMLTYISREDETKKSFSKEIEKNELYTFFMDTIEYYYKFTKLNLDNKEEMIVTGKETPFPYKTYRNSQKVFMSAVYKSIQDKNKLFAEAPTGVGKTLSTLYPSIKGLSNGLGKKIFYITAKSITKNVCLENLEMLLENGFRGISLNITSKENICANSEIKCDSQYCKRAERYFDNINNAVYDIIKSEKILTDKVIKLYAKKHNICPYSFQLELIDFVHIVVCDYNYVYNPTVAFTKYFDKEKNDFIILVDEAHNLEDRSRDFFSATIKKSSFELLKNNVDNTSIIRLCSSIIKNFSAFFEMEESYSSVDIPKSLVSTLSDLRFMLDEFFGLNELDEELKEEILNAYFSIDNFLKTSTYYDKKYKTLFEIENNDKSITLFCIDTSTRFFKVNTLCRNVVFFSATLTPINYFSDLFGGSKEDFFIRLKTSFNQENQLTIIDNKISTYYKDRQNSYSKIAHKIDLVVTAKKGNYFVFFPSYAYLKNVLEVFRKIHTSSKIEVQKSDMTKTDREILLNSFNSSSEPTIAFLVSGGVFSEGVNLCGEKLIGSIVVGVGISMLNFKSDTVKEHFDNYNKMGYEFAYMYQGFNKILQSAGRVIRSESDRGIILLIDTRYTKNDYINLFPEHYSERKIITDDKKLLKTITEFWENC